MNIKLFRQFIEALDDNSLNVLKREIGKAIISRKQKRKELEPIASINSKSHDINLENLLQEDWSSLFDQYDNQEKCFYVYLHGNPKGPTRSYKSLSCKTFGKPIYVGMGQNDRAYNFKRGTLHTKALSDIEELGYSREHIVHIISDGLTEKEARELESKLILFFGIRSCFKGKTSNRRNRLALQESCLLNAKYEPMPEKYLRLQE